MMLEHCDDDYKKNVLGIGRMLDEVDRRDIVGTALGKSVNDRGKQEDEEERDMQVLWEEG